MKDWVGIEEFLEVAASLSFSKAADRLGISKSHVSKRIRDLEDRMGVRLLSRTTRAVALTDAGRDYAERCRKIVDNLKDAELILKDQQVNPVGLIRLTVAGAFGEQYLVPLLAEFMAMHPRLEVALDFTNRQVNLMEEPYDLAVRAGPLSDNVTYSARRLTGYRLMVCASPAYLDVKGRPKTPQDLSHHDCLVGTLPFWRFSRGSSFEKVHISGRWHANNGHALVAAAKAGLGLTQLPEFYVRQAITDGSLIPVLEDWQKRDIDIWALYYRRDYLPTKVRLLISFLEEKLPNRL
ncbi:MAG: LysR family transcriptional regulator [Proteobacteria bacterium]|nr:MAG: LysR family transcriptional regulator [Pseudomonadota bacterium]